MLKKLLITTAVSGLMLSSALAQYSSPNAAQSSSTAASPSSSDSMKSDASKSSTSSSMSGSGSTTIISAQKPDQLLASKFKGTDVIGSDNQKIGDVSDILFTKDGKIDAFILSVGGFLGVGAKEVAIAPSAAQWVADDKNKDSFKLKVSLSKEQLAQAPAFQESKSQRSTTGAGPNATAPRMAPNTPGNSAAPSNSMAPGSNAPASR